MKVKFEASFERDLKNLRDKNLLQKIKKTLNKVIELKDIRQISGLKKLRGYETFYRIKIKDYIIGIEIIGSEIIFVRFLHRKEVYRFFSVKVN